MIECILPNIYRIEIPLPKNPLKALNSYLIKDPGETFWSTPADLRPAGMLDQALQNWASTWRDRPVHHPSAYRPFRFGAAPVP